MFYDKKVKYLDYRKNGVRIHGAGFLKLDVRNGMCSALLQVSGLHVTDNFCKQVCLVGADREEVLCTIQIREGRGESRFRVPAGNLVNGLSYENLVGIRVPIAAGCELYCDLGNVEIINGTEAYMTVEGEDAFTERPVEESAVLGENLDVEDTGHKEDISDENIVHNEELTADLTVSEGEGYIAETEEKETFERKEEGHEQKIMEDKWDQLWALYPHITPFGDEREYLKLYPEDFVILNSRFYKLVHNSFLLHGYYNYRHLILSRSEKRGEPCYYVGVPGNFYDREKQVAIMFGFESFECKEEPADIGEYGYYMIRVEL